MISFFFLELYFYTFKTNIFKTTNLYINVIYYTFSSKEFILLYPKTSNKLFLSSLILTPVLPPILTTDLITVLSAIFMGAKR